VAGAVESRSEVREQHASDGAIVPLYPLRSTLPWKTPQRTLQPCLGSSITSLLQFLKTFFG